MELYLALNNQTTSHFPNDSETLAETIWAMITAKRVRKCDVDEKEEVNEILGKLETLDTIALEDLVPKGDPSVEAVAYYGNSGIGSPIDLLLGTPEFLNKKLDHRKNYLMGEAFVGSSSNAYTPLLNVVKRKKTGKNIHEALPQFMVYQDGMYIAAEYNLETGSFRAINGSRIEPDTLKLVSGVMQLSDYHRGYGIFDKLDQLRTAPNGMSLRRKTGNDRKKVLAFRKKLTNGLYATLSEIEDAISKINTLDGSVDHNQIFNRFLLYKAFESKIKRDIKHGHTSNNTSYLVGSMTGDTQTMALPYVAVELRR